MLGSSDCPDCTTIAARNASVAGLVQKLCSCADYIKRSAYTFSTQAAAACGQLRNRCPRLTGSRTFYRPSATAQPRCSPRVELYTASVRTSERLVRLLGILWLQGCIKEFQTSTMETAKEMVNKAGETLQQVRHALCSESTMYGYNRDCQ